MVIKKLKMVTIDYTVTDSSGAVLDSSDGKGPLMYIHGMGEILPALELNLEGKKVGESFKVVIPPNGAYLPDDDPMANETLTFEVVVLEVRDATDEELDSLSTSGCGGGCCGHDGGCDDECGDDCDDDSCGSGGCCGSGGSCCS